MRRVIFLISLLFFGLSNTSFAQNKSSKAPNINPANRAIIDSIDILVKLSKDACNSNCELGLPYAFRALQLAVKVNSLAEKAKAYNSIGIAYKYVGKYSLALEYQLKSLNAQMALGDKKGIAKAANNLSLVYLLQNNYLKALEYQLRSLKLKEEIGDIQGLAFSYENLGKIYSAQGKSNETIELFQKALAINKTFNDTAGLIHDYVNIGTEFKNLKKFGLARINLEKALEMKVNGNGYDSQTANIYNDLANLNSDDGKTELALSQYQKSLEINLQINDKLGIALSYLNLADILISHDNFNKANQYLRNSLKISKDIVAHDLIIKNYELLMILNEKNGNFKDALGYSKLYKYASDENSNRNNFEKLNELGIKYDTDKKEKEISLLNKDKVLKAKEIAFQTTVKNYLIVISSMILVSLFLIFRLYQNKQKDNILLQAQKEEIETQKQSITDSINYAYRIQQSILPSQQHFSEILTQSFVLNKPKDIVSGDFYWLHETSPFKYSSVNSKVLLAMVDCTGHGVPGAFMSMMGVELLNEAVNESHSPAKILQLVDEGIRKALHTNNIDSKKDGMDMALCAFDFEKNTVKFCGANRPIYRIREGVMEIFTPQKTSVGFSEPGFVFMNREIDIAKNDTIYLFSDGYADQFGGTKDKKLTTKKFKDLLMSLQTIPIAEQGKELDKFITAWSGKNQQVDDILVIGVKV
jgi:serine phosphatase RsbU (regulator of sigma subunit)